MSVPQKGDIYCTHGKFYYLFLYRIDSETWKVMSLTEGINYDLSGYEFPPSIWVKVA